MCSILLRARSLYFSFFLEVVVVVGSARFGSFLVTTIDFYFSNLPRTRSPTAGNISKRQG
jgi:hypothetical protein